MANLDNDVKTTKDVEKLLMAAADSAAVQSDEEHEEYQKKLGVVYHDSHADRRSVKSILKMYKKQSIQLPLCQRVYVWQAKQRKDLLYTIKCGLGIGTLRLATHKGDSDNVLYLVDGQQRLVSLMLISADDSLSDDEKQAVLNYQMQIFVAYGLTWDEMAEWFVLSNGGISVGQATKKTAALPANLRNLGIKLAGNNFFRNAAKKANTTFSKNEQYKTISWNILLACAGIDIGSNQSSKLYKRIQTYEDDIVKNANKAESIMNTLTKIYQNIKDDSVIKRSLNANYLSVLPYIMIKYPTISADKYTELTKFIFANRCAVKSYANTTHGGAAGESNVKARYSVLIDMLNTGKTKDVAIVKTKTNTKENSKKDKEYKTTDNINEADYYDFCKRHNGEVINTRDNNHPINFGDLIDAEKHSLYQFSEIEKNANKVEGTIIKAYLRVAKVTEEEEKKEMA